MKDTGHMRPQIEQQGEDSLFNLKDAEAYTGLHCSVLLDAVERGVLRVELSGRSKRFRREWLENWARLQGYGNLPVLQRSSEVRRRRTQRMKRPDESIESTTGGRSLEPLLTAAPSHSYAATILARMRPENRRLNEHISYRELGRRIGGTYEHVRRICHGEVTFSKQTNDAICRELGLDADAMWKVAQSEKLRKKFGASGAVADLIAKCGDFTQAEQEAVRIVISAIDAARSKRVAE